MSTKILILVILTLLFSQSGFAQQAPTPEQLMQNLGIDATKIADLEGGKIISYEVSETSQKELAIGVAMLLPANVKEIFDFIKGDQLMTINPDIKTFGTIERQADIHSFDKFGYTDKQLKEAKAFIEAKAGSDFNLSTGELDALKSLRMSLENADDKTLLNAANLKYREFLLQRYQAYRMKGLPGIDPYSRKDGQADPSAELQVDAEHSKLWATYLPALKQAWANYPMPLPEGTIERMLWYNQQVEDRPTPILLHRVIFGTDSAGILLSRQYYVGHSYNSSQVVVGALPYGQGTVVFYSTRSSTDQVAGIGSSLKHSIGREQLRKAMTSYLQQLNKKLKQKS
jgi:hypothetical protein